MQRRNIGQNIVKQVQIVGRRRVDYQVQKTGADNAVVFGFARAHYRMIARFGRFPHRNRLLGRKSTAEEKEAVKAGNDW